MLHNPNTSDYFVLTRFGNQEARYHLVEYGDYVDDMGDGIMGTTWHSFRSPYVYLLSYND